VRRRSGRCWRGYKCVAEVGVSRAGNGSKHFSRKLEDTAVNRKHGLQ
jgi:hypothetical protein